MDDSSGNWPSWLSNAFNAVGNFLEKTWKALSQSWSISGEVGNGLGAKAKAGPVSLDITAIIVGDKWTKNSDGTNESVRQGSLTVQAEIVDNVNVGVDVVYYVPLDEGKKKGLWCADGGKFDVVAGAFAYNWGLGYSTVSTQDVEISFGLAGYLYLGGGFEVSLNVSKFIEIWCAQ